MLELREVNAFYAHVQVLKEINLSVGRGTITTLIGANGAGKTTVLRNVGGIARPRSGRIFFEGRDITHWPAHQVSQAGISMIPEGRAIFQKMSVQENLEMGAYNRRDNEIARDMDDLMDRFPILRERRTRPAGNLSGGEQQMLAIARALMARPKLLLLDEPSMGLAPQMVAEIFKIIEEIHQRGTTILLVEQNARQALKITDRAYVLETGRIVLHGTAGELEREPRVIAAYLGKRAAGC